MEIIIRKTVKGLFGLLLCILCIAAVRLTGIEAASADLFFTSEKKNYEVGEVFDVELNIKAEVAPGDFTGFIRYSSDCLEYVGESERIAGGEGLLKLTDIVDYSDHNSRKYILSFKAVKRGYADITMRDDVELYEYEEGYLMSVSSNTLTLAIGAAESASEDASLASLKVSPGQLTPSFLPNTLEYRVSVPYETERIVISAVPNSSAASVQTEVPELEVGRNRILVTVTSEAGTICRYVIYCIRNEKEPENAPTTTVVPENTPTPDTSDEEKPDDFEGPEADFYAKKEGDELQLFCDSKYIVADNAEGVEIPEGYSKTNILVNDIRIPVYAPNNNPSSDYLLMVLKREGAEPELYRYDRREKTLQRNTVTKSSGVVISTDSIETRQLKDSYDKSLNIMTLIIAALSGICMILLIIVIRLATRAGRDEID